MKLSIEELREEIYNDYIQTYDNLSHEEITNLVDNYMTQCHDKESQCNTLLNKITNKQIYTFIQ